VHDFLDCERPLVTVCMRCGLAELEPGWERCLGAFVAHQIQLAIRSSIQRNEKTGRIMLIERAK
jgi:hypothetical protein